MEQATKETPRTTPAPIIHINGFPGTGKLSIAKRLTELLKSNAGIPTKLVHNHLLINPADAILHRTQRGYQALRRAIRAAVFGALVTDPDTYGTVYIFTDFQSTDALGSSVCAEYAATAAARGCRLVPVVLHCEEVENLRRVVLSDRATVGKLVDFDLVRKIRRDGPPVHRFVGNGASLELDVTEFSVEEAAKEVLRHVVEVCPELSTHQEGQKT
jgi:hypothetical protein